MLPSTALRRRVLVNLTQSYVSSHCCACILKCSRSNPLFMGSNTFAGPYLDWGARE